MRQRNPQPSSSSEDTTSSPEKVPADLPTENAEEGENHHDHPIDDAKLDSLLWELLKFCVPVGLVLWLSIYLMYRNQLSSWTDRKALGRNSSGNDKIGAEGLEGWLRKEEKVAWEGILKNVGPAVGAMDGAVVASPSEGESEGDPDYYYTWTRDSALTILTVLSRFLPPSYLKPWAWDPVSGIDNGGGVSGHALNFSHHHHLHASEPLIEPLIRAYITSNQKLQTVVSRSGDLWTGGLNEPKFYVDGAAFDGDWGRPQRDGPSLRALSLIPYANYLLDRAFPADIAFVHDNLYDPHVIRQAGKVIKNDLEEVAGGWWASGFDLWEEVEGQHFFTLLASYRALQAGATLALRLGDEGAARFYLSQADMIDERLRDFKGADGVWRATIGLGQQEDASASVESQARDGDDGEDGVSHREDLIENYSTRAERKSSYNDDSSDTHSMAGEFDEGFHHHSHPHGRTGLDCAIPLSVIHFGTAHPSTSSIANPTASSDNLFDIDAADDDVLASLRAYILSFASLYRINDGRAWTEGWGVGRYREDVYNGVGTSKGNPWFICTFAVAQSFYNAAESYTLKGSITVTNATVAFWSDLLDTRIESGTHWAAIDSSDQFRSGTRDAKKSKNWRRAQGPFDLALKRLRETGDAFMRIGEKYAVDGRMSEQFHRTDGSLTGARDLTWSYAAFLDASRARQSTDVHRD